MEMSKVWDLLLFVGLGYTAYVVWSAVIIFY
jgi:hypothetical protein